MRIVDFLKNLLSVILDGSFERIKIISAMNQNFNESFISGGLDRLCRVSISSGDPQFRHSMSAIWFRSGFKISVENDYGMRDHEIFEISEYILNNRAFLRQMMALGFDTLIIQGKLTGRGKMFCMHKYSDLGNFMLKEKGTGNENF
jgi:hypothetical protein